MIPLAAAASVAASIAIFLIALAFALAFLYFGLKWVSKNEDQTRAALAKVGITTPDPAPTQPDPIAPPPPIPGDPAAPIQPIVLSAPVASPVAASGTPKLVDGSGQTFPLGEGTNLVSRESGAVVLGGQATVSRRHAEIVRTGAVAIVRDLGSTNGTFVNGARVSGEQSLRPGDSVQFGAVSLRYEA